MKKNIKNLDYYGFDTKDTMYDINSYPISSVLEHENEKYIVEFESNDNNDSNDDDNQESGNTVDSGDTQNG